MSPLMKQVLRLVFLIPLLFAAGLQAPAEVSAAQPDFPIPMCKADCLISSNINIKPVQYGRTTLLTGSILVVDETGAPVSQAAVTVVWTLPDGSQQTQVVSTSRSGIAGTSIVKLQNGVFTLRVEYIAKQGHMFAPYLGIGVAIFKG